MFYFVQIGAILRPRCYSISKFGTRSLTLYDIPNPNTLFQHGRVSEHPSFVLSRTRASLNRLLLPPIHLDCFRPHGESHFSPSTICAIPVALLNYNQQQTSPPILRPSTIPPRCPRWLIKPPPPPPYRPVMWRKGWFWIPTSCRRWTYVQ
jgi:hypothetical protein